jgi:hypothetical protein
VFDTIGLAVFMGCVGPAAGPSFVSGLRSTGPSLLVVGVVVAVTPHLAAVFFGRSILGMNAVVIRVSALPVEFKERLDPYVRGRFAELWRAAQAVERE